MPLLHDDPPPAPSRPCAYQGCERAAEVYPVVQIPPPAEAHNGQPLRVVLRRSCVCDAHRWEMVAELGPRLREALTPYFVRRALPPVDWEAATWEFEPVEAAQ